MFALFMALMAVFVLSVHGIGRALTAEDAERSPFARLFKAGRALHGARRIEELGDRLLEELRPLLRFDDFYLVLVDREQASLDFRVHEQRGERQPGIRLPLATGLFGLVVARGEPLLVADWPRAPEPLRRRALETAKATGSVIVVPLQHDGAVIGLVSVQHTEAHVYSKADLNLLQRLSEHLAAAVADARAFEDLEDYRARLEERVAERTAELQKAARDKERLIAALREQSTRARARRARGPAHRHRQPPPLHAAPGRGDRGGAGDGAAADARHRRPRPLQARQRRPRARHRRRGAQAERRADAGPVPRRPTSSPASAARSSR